MSEASKQSDGDLELRLARVRLAVFDVDGTLTDGRGKIKIEYYNNDELERILVLLRK